MTWLMMSGAPEAESHAHGRNPRTVAVTKSQGTTASPTTNPKIRSTDDPSPESTSGKPSMRPCSNWLRIKPRRLRTQPPLRRTAPDPPTLDRRPRRRDLRTGKRRVLKSQTLKKAFASTSTSSNLSAKTYPNLTRDTTQLYSSKLSASKNKGEK